MTLLLLQFNQESLSKLGRPSENKQQWEALMNPSEQTIWENKGKPLGHRNGRDLHKVKLSIKRFYALQRSETTKSEQPFG